MRSGNLADHYKEDLILIHSVYREVYREIQRKENVENPPMSSIYKESE